MKIRDHYLDEDVVVRKETPNRSGPFGNGLPDTIIIHYTAGGSAESSVNTLCDPKTKASAHLVIGREGSIYQLVPFNLIAWHAGRSAHQGRVGFNKYAIGIELDNAGRLTKSGEEYVSWFGRAYPENEVVEAVHRNESEPSCWHRYTEEQIAISQDICADLIENYGITSILGHEEVSPGRKVDPGPAFPMDKLRELLLYRDRGAEVQEEPSPFPFKGVVTASKLNIRQSPRLKAGTVAAPLTKGTIVEILREENGWYEVDVKMRGWVKKEYIKA
ncbi:MAG: N-acetylmuramoyl-L-alanine amidase [Deltaproteobacteria bacterium]|nr:MAG: N-acetylmuramoyl-L-alanine amidase [Deltaproteobacteria bacterium]